MAGASNPGAPAVVCTPLRSPRDPSWLRGGIPDNGPPAAAAGAAGEPGDAGRADPILFRIVTGRMRVPPNTVATNPTGKRRTRRKVLAGCIALAGALLAIVLFTPLAGVLLLLDPALSWVDLRLSRACAPGWRSSGRCWW